MSLFKKILLFLLLDLIFFLFFIACKPKHGVPETPATYKQGESIVLQTICFGSCNKQWEDQSYWQTIAKESPDLWIWMGDIIYSDTEDMSQLKNQYDFQKKHEDYQAFRDSTVIIGIWDDHDYGVNDGGNDYPKRRESRDLLFDFLDLEKSNPAFKRQGAYQSYVYGPEGKKIKIYLLDGRYFRDPLTPDTITEQRYLPNMTGTYLGEDQWDWLEQELNNSEAQVNLIVSGIQVIPTQQNFEKWANFPNERIRLFNLIKDSKVKNPIFLSGDRHIGEISVYKLDEETTFYEVTSSGLTHSYEKADEENKYRVGDLVREKNYGVISLDWSVEDIAIKLQINNIDGNVINELKL